MKTSAVLAFFVMLGGFLNISNIRAQDYKSMRQEVIIEDNFYDNRNGWWVGDNSTKTVSIRNGIYRCYNKKDPVLFCTVPVYIDQSRDFMIEGKVAYKRGTSGYGLIFGRTDDKTSWRYIVTDRDGQFFIRKMEYGTRTAVQSWKSSSAIYQNHRMNTYTIVKQGRTLKFYANGTKIKEYPFSEFKGNQYGFFCGNSSTIEAEYFKVAYLGGSNNFVNQNNNNNYNRNDYNNNNDYNRRENNDYNKKPAYTTSGPTIDIREPEITRGFKTVSVKLVRVAGFAKTSAGLYEVLVNGMPAYLGPDGYFSVEVPLKPGNNTINVKATDTKYKSSTKSFTVKREY